MKYIYSPWRNMSNNNQSKKKNKECVFCQIVKDDIKDAHILYEAEHSVLLMNKYPYSSGHILLISKYHVSSVVQLKDYQWSEMSILTKQVSALITNTLNTKHINIGINIDEYAGASIAGHLHIHFVPRYKGDTNFMTAIFDTRVYPNNFDEIYESLKANVCKYINPKQ